MRTRHRLATALSLLALLGCGSGRSSLGGADNAPQNDSGAGNAGASGSPGSGGSGGGATTGSGGAAGTGGIDAGGAAGSGNAAGATASDSGVAPLCPGTVAFGDINVERAAQGALGITGPVTGAAAASLDFLAIPFSETAPLTSLKGIECFTGLTRLDIGGPDIPSLGLVDLTPVASIAGLKTFDIHRDEYDADAGHPSAPRAVFLDLTPLAHHPGLKGVRLEINAVKDIAALGTLSLSVLTLGSQFVTDISPIGKLADLGRVLLRGKGITDLSPLAPVLPTWKGGIIIMETSVVDISVLSGLTGIQSLGLDHNLIVDISALAGLSQLTNLSVAGNPIDCATQLVYLKAFEAAGVRIKHDCP